MRGLKWLEHTARRTRARFLGGAVILLYHRITETSADPFSMNVQPKHFGEHLDVIRRHAVSASLQDLVEAIDLGVVPRRAVAVTFDDGYADNLYQARPLLERHDIPATIFVTSGLVGRRGDCWWDELAQLTLVGTLPAEVELTLEGQGHRWRSDNRRQLLRSLHGRLRSLPDAERDEALDQLRRVAGADRATAIHPTLSPDELRELADGVLVDAGAHTVNHPVLSTLSHQAQRREILDSKARLEDLLGRRIRACSYPYGMRSDYTAETMSIVREAGYQCGCAAFPDVVRPSSNPFGLPRVWVEDCDGDTFARFLSRWLH